MLFVRVRVSKSEAQSEAQALLLSVEEDIWPTSTVAAHCLILCRWMSCLERLLFERSPSQDSDDCDEVENRRQKNGLVFVERFIR